MQSLNPADLPTLEQIVEFSPLIVLPDTPLMDVLALMNRVSSDILESKSDFSSCVLVVEETSLIGILTLRDIVRLTGMGRDLSSVTISEVMTQPVISLRLAPAENALTALSFMHQHGIRHLPVVDEQGQLVGLITQDRIRQVIQPVHLLKLRYVTEVMITEVIHALPTTSVLALSQMMSDRQISCVVIVAQQKTELIPVGMITEKDIIKFQLQRLDIAQTQAQAVMSTPVLSISPTESLWTVHQLIQERRVRRLAVVGEQGELQGLVTQTNLLQVLDPLEIVRVTQILQAKVEEQTVQLRQTNQQLEHEVKQRHQVEESLRQSQQELEFRVAERTAQLVQVNERLQQEIEECKQTKIELQQSEHQWKALFDHALDAIAIADDEGRYVDVNPAACKLFGVSREELLGSTIADFTESGFDFTQVWQQFCEQGQMSGEFSLYRPDGTVCETEFAAVANFIPHLHLSILRDVSDRQAALHECKQAEAAVRESEQQLQAVIDNSPSVIYLKDMQGRHMLVNSKFERISYLTREQVKNKTVFEIFSADIAQALTTNDQNVLASRTSLQFEEEIPMDDGLHTYLTVKFPLCDSFSQPYAICGIATDITERKQTEQILRNIAEGVSATTGETFFYSLVQYLANTLQVDYALIAIVVNVSTPYMKTIAVFGNGTTIDNFEYDLANTPCKDAITQKLCLYTNNVQQEFPQDTLLAELNIESYIGSPLFDSAGSVLGLIVVMHRQQLSKPDLAVSVLQTFASRAAAELERKQAQQKIQEQAALIDIATDAIYVRDLENRILFWSQGAERLYGWTAEESFGQNADQFVCRETLSQIAAASQATLEHGSWQGELEQITTTGRKIIVASRWTLVNNQFGQPESILVVNTDITEKKQLEQQFYRAQRLESLGTLASGIAHDLNNVFAPMMMIAQLLPLRCKNVDARTQELFKTLETSSKRGANLVKQILTFARGTEGKRILLQPGHLLTELVKVIKQTFPKSIEIVNDIPTNALWMVEADPTQLEQVFMNLAINARDAMPNNGTLTINAENQMIDETYAQMYLEAKPGGYIVVTVSDTGTGIPPEFLERIFDPFFTTKEVGKSTGLGLSTVLGIVKNHGGFVKVSSQVNEGTQFQVFLPRREGTAIETITNVELLRGNGELILVVDDEPVVQKTTQETLADYNYKTLVANDGIEAIAQYVQFQQQISVVLLDMLMPNMDGLTVIRTLRTLNPNVNIIAISGLPANEQKAIAVGAKMFLSKPYTATDLLTTLSTAIGIRE